MFDFTHLCFLKLLVTCQLRTLHCENEIRMGESIICLVVKRDIFILRQQCQSHITEFAFAHVWMVCLTSCLLCYCLSVTFIWQQMRWHYIDQDIVLSTQCVCCKRFLFNQFSERRHFISCLVSGSASIYSFPLFLCVGVLESLSMCIRLHTSFLTLHTSSHLKQEKRTEFVPLIFHLSPICSYILVAFNLHSSRNDQH